ncbi:ribonucleoside triphosphate reductase [candidate division KSB1 bacterium]|nr:MAG: ribonucleoside triphosphate reductase [candidate division KSB1 bacterium]
MKFQQIRKRDGRIVPFDATKITQAINKAGQATDEFNFQTAQQLCQEVLRRLALAGESRIPEVEEVQDIVETVLMESPFKKTARAYIIYREQHARLREVRTIVSRNMVDGYLSYQDWRVNENSNMSYSIQGLNNYISSTITAQYWLNTIYPPEIREAHQNGDFHIHDLGILAVYCVGWDLRDLLLKGFKGASGKVESKPARHLRSALGQVVNFFYTLQGEAAGAQAFSNFDTYLAPFIRYDNLSYQEVKQALQEFVFNVNVPTRVGFQTPFTNLTFDLTPPSMIKNEAVIIGGKLTNMCYGEFQPEMDMLNRAFAEVMCEGDAKGRVFTFPIPTYNITKDFDWNNPNLEAIWKMTAKYGIPYFSNFINSDMKPEDARSMCCRLRLDNRDLRKRGGGLFGANPLTGSIGVVTINLPRIGYLSQSREEFFSHLEYLMNLAKESLEIKRKVLEKFTEKKLYPYAHFYLSQVKQQFGQYWKNHFATIGLIGLNEALLNLLGKDIGTSEGRAFAIEVLDFMRNRLMDYQAETNNIYNLEATPAEGASYRLAKIDREKFPNIRSASTNGEPYYTNSSQLPVNYTDDIFEALMLQDELQTRYTGGTVFHCFLGEQIFDPEMAKLLVRKIAENFRLPYFTLTPTFSICPNHGYISGKLERCPRCGATTEVYSRVVGYLRPINQWNLGKKTEFKERKTFSFN